MADTSRIPGMQELYDFAASLDTTQRAAFFTLIGDGSSVPPAADRLKFAQTLSNDTQRTEFFALFGSTPKPVVDLDNFTRKQIQQELDNPGSVAGLKGVPRDVLEAYLNPSSTRRPRKPAQPRQRSQGQGRSRQTTPDGTAQRTAIFVILAIVAPFLGGLAWHFLSMVLPITGGLAAAATGLFIVIPLFIVIYIYLFKGPNYAFRDGSGSNNQS